VRDTNSAAGKLTPAFSRQDDVDLELRRRLFEARRKALQGSWQSTEVAAKEDEVPRLEPA
jgi:hypothetical protein